MITTSKFCWWKNQCRNWTFWTANACHLPLDPGDVLLGRLWLFWQDLRQKQIIQKLEQQDQKLLLLLETTRKKSAGNLGACQIGLPKLWKNPPKRPCLVCFADLLGICLFWIWWVIPRSSRASKDMRNPHISICSKSVCAAAYTYSCTTGTQQRQKRQQK